MVLHSRNSIIDIETSVAAVVVTYNRKQRLEECLKALLQQLETCDVIVIDNASTDGTKNYLYTKGYLQKEKIHYRQSEDNIGGAGGFRKGLEYGLSKHWNWFWLMDDDALPDPDALKNLLRYARSNKTVFGSVAANTERGRLKLSWPVFALRKQKLDCLQYHHDLKSVESVDMIPFLGFLVHRDTVSKVGFPDPGFFICADDKEYSERVKSYGVELKLVKNSLIHHPISRSRIMRFGKYQAAYRSLPPWKLYYDVRNKILIGKKYFGMALWTQTLPGIFIRACLSLLIEKQKLQCIRMHFKAICDGLLSRKGQRVPPA